MAQPLLMAWRGGGEGKCASVLVSLVSLATSGFAAGAGSAFAAGIAASLAAAIMAGSLPRAPGDEDVAGLRSDGANCVEGVDPIGAAAASVSARASSLLV